MSAAENFTQRAKRFRYCYISQNGGPALDNKMSLVINFQRACTLSATSRICLKTNLLYYIFFE